MIYTVTLSPAVDKTMRIPGFAAGQVNRAQSMRVTPGGKGVNVSKAIQCLGGRSAAMGILGGATGRFIQASLDTMGIDADFTFTRHTTRTNLKIIDPLARVTTDVNEPGEPVTDAVLARVLRRLLARVQPGDVIVFSGKLPPGAMDTIYRDWCERLRRTGVRVCVDADGIALLHATQAHPDALKPNADEFARLTGKHSQSLSDMAGEALALCASGVGLVAVSLGERGLLVARGGRALYARGLAVDVVSTVGAGDATMAAIALGLERDEPLEDMAKTALAAGACAVTGDIPGVLSLQRVMELREQVVWEEIQV